MEEREREEGEAHAALVAADVRVGVRATEIAAARFLERAISTRLGDEEDTKYVLHVHENT